MSDPNEYPGEHRRESQKRRVLSPTQARQGVTPHITRYVLGWGMFLVVCAFALVYLLQK